MSKRKDLITGICGMIFSAAVFGLSVQIGLKETTAIGADFLPKIVSAIMFIMFAMVAYRGAKHPQEEKPVNYPLNYKGVLIIFVSMMAYGILLKPLGFVISSVLFLALMILLMTKKEELKPVKMILITVISVLVIYFLFREVFGIRLPKGIL